MKFIIDNALSFKLAEILSEAGFDTVHVRDYNMQAAKDIEIFERAAQEDRIVVSPDTDFGTLLAQRITNKPSVILFRWESLRLPEDQAKVILDNIPSFQDEIDKGCLVVIEESRVRIRSLPLLNKG